MELSRIVASADKISIFKENIKEYGKKRQITLLMDGIRPQLQETGSHPVASAPSA
jgi:hypothetical protein